MERLKFPRRKISERKQLILDNDAIFRDIIRARDKVCQKTGKTTNLHVCHFYTRRMLNLRWNEDNACLLNAGIHLFWSHQHYEEFRDWWIKRLGGEKFIALKLKSRYVSTIYTSDLKLINIALKKRLEEIR